MKTVQGSLPVNRDYKITDIDYQPMECATTCQNCGRIISNIATIENDKGSQFVVGLDCAESLKGCGTGESWEIMECKKKLARRARFVRWYKKECKLAAFWDSKKDCILFYDFAPSKWDSRYKYRMNANSFAKEYAFLETPTQVFES